MNHGLLLLLSTSHCHEQLSAPAPASAAAWLGCDCTSHFHFTLSPSTHTHTVQYSLVCPALLCHLPYTTRTSNAFSPTSLHHRFAIAFTWTLSRSSQAFPSSGGTVLWSVNLKSNEHGRQSQPVQLRLDTTRYSLSVTFQDCKTVRSECLLYVTTT